MSESQKILLGRIGFTPGGTYDKDKTFQKNQWVNTSDSVYVSLKDENKGHAVTDTEWWTCWVNGQPGTAAAEAANKAATSANTAATEANKQAARAKEYGDNPPKIGDNGYWWTWNETTKKYEDTGIWAKGGIQYPSLEINPDTMELVMTYQEELLKEQFQLNNKGELTFNFR